MLVSNVRAGCEKGKQVRGEIMMGYRKLFPFFWSLLSGSAQTPGCGCWQAPFRGQKTDILAFESLNVKPAAAIKFFSFISISSTQTDLCTSLTVTLLIGHLCLNVQSSDLPSLSPSTIQSIHQISTFSDLLFFLWPLLLCSSFCCKSLYLHIMWGKVLLQYTSLLIFSL